MNRLIKILLVEDEAIPALMLMQEFQELGYLVCKSNGRSEDAFKKAMQEVPDIILMDIQLIGNKDGIDTAEHILQYKNIPIIFMSGYDDDTYKARALKLNPTAYLIKPIDTSEIDTIIKKQFELNQTN